MDATQYRVGCKYNSREVVVTVNIDPSIEAFAFDQLYHPTLALLKFLCTINQRLQLFNKFTDSYLQGHTGSSSLVWCDART
jgi:hypothetical protein